MGGLIASLGLGAGGNSAAAGANYQAAGTKIINPVGVNDIPAAQGNVNQALSQQQAFTQALQAQNGIGNQSNVYGQLGGIANGTGPNPAMAALNQATGNNTANQASLMAGQRGSGANTGLIARQAAQQGAATQQQAAGQGATMQANQSLNALNLQGGIAGQQVANQAGAVQNQSVASQNEQQNLLNAIAAQNNANVAMQSNQNNANAGVAQQVARSQANLASGLTGAIGSSGLLGAAATGIGAIGNGIANGVGSLFSGPSTMGDLSGIDGSAVGDAGLAGGAGDAGGDAAGEIGDAFSYAAKGGSVNKLPKYAEGGDVSGEQYTASDESGNAPAVPNQTSQPVSSGAPVQQTSFIPSQETPEIAGIGSIGPKSAVGKYLTNPTPTPIASNNPDFSSGVANTEMAKLIPQDKGSQDNLRGLLRGPINYGNAGDSWEDETIGGLGAGITAVAGAEIGPAAAAIGAANTLSNANAGPRGDANLAHGGKVPAMVSPGEIYLNKNKAQAVAKGKANPMSGERIPGKAKVKGDSLKNDTVPKTLEAGGVVIPRSIMNEPDAAKKAAAFVTAHLAKSGHFPRKSKS